MALELRTTFSICYRKAMENSNSVFVFSFHMTIVPNSGKREEKKNLRTIQEISSLFKLNGFQSNKHSVICFSTYRKDRKVHYSYAVMGFFLYYKILMEHFLLLISNTRESDSLEAHCPLCGTIQPLNSIQFTLSLYSRKIVTSMLSNSVLMKAFMN